MYVVRISVYCGKWGL